MKKCFIILNFILFIFLSMNESFTQENAVAHYHKAFCILENTFKINDHKTFVNFSRSLYEHFDKILNGTAKENGEISWKNNLEISEVLNHIRQGTLAKKCVWEFQYEGPETPLDDIAKANALINILLLEFYEKIADNNHKEAVFFWNDAVVLSRRLGIGNGFICYSKGLSREKECIIIASKVLPILNDVKLLEILKNTSETDECSTLKDSIMYECIQILDWTIEKPFDAARYFDYPSSVIIDQVFIKKYIDNYVNLVSLPPDDFEIEYNRFFSKIEALPDSYNKIVLEGIFPALPAGRNMIEELSNFKKLFLHDLEMRKNEIASDYNCPPPVPLCACPDGVLPSKNEASNDQTNQN